MTAVPFPVTSAPGLRPIEGSGRLINAYAKTIAAGNVSSKSWCRAPGLKAWASSGKTGFRGGALVNGNLFAAFAGKLGYFNSAGTWTEIGNLPGTKSVTWAANNKTPTPDIICVDPDFGAYEVTTTGVSFFNGGGVLPNPYCCASQDGYILFGIADGRYFNTDLNSLAMNSLWYAKAEGKRDPLLRIVPFSDLYLCGTQTIEVWINQGNATGSPYSRSRVIQRGIVGKDAVGGFEDNFGKGIVFVGDDRNVYLLNGYVPQPISTPDVNRALSSLSEVEAAEIDVFPFTHNGRPCVAVSCAKWTWVFDLAEQWWHERISFGLSRWRVRRSIYAFGKWLAGDTETGNIVEITPNARDEVGKPLLWRVESGPVSAFPNRTAVPQATFNVAQGTGIATGNEPVDVSPDIEITWSDDGGLSWSEPRLRQLGRQSEMSGPIKLTKTGSTQNTGRRWRLTVANPVDVVLLGGDQSTEMRRA